MKVFDYKYLLQFQTFRMLIVNYIVGVSVLNAVENQSNKTQEEVTDVFCLTWLTMVCFFSVLNQFEDYNIKYKSIIDKSEKVTFPKDIQDIN